MQHPAFLHSLVISLYHRASFVTSLVFIVISLSWAQSAESVSALLPTLSRSRCLRGVPVATELVECVIVFEERVSSPGKPRSRSLKFTVKPPTPRARQPVRYFQEEAVTKVPCFINTFGGSSLIVVSRSVLLRSDLEDRRGCSLRPESVAAGELLH